MCTHDRLSECVLDGETGEVFQRRLSPDHREILEWLAGLPAPVAVTYEAGPTGFGLARALIGGGYRLPGGGTVEAAATGRGSGQDRPVDRTIGPRLGGGACDAGLGWLGSQLVSSDADVPRELSGLVVPRRGSLVATGELFEPYRLVDGDGAVVVPVAGFFAELAACGRPATTQRSYGMDLLRWFRFLWAIGVGWDQATRVEARDFCRWLQVAVKPTRPHWR